MSDIRYFETSSVNAPFNLAMEEAVAEAVGKGFHGSFLLWQNGPSVIIGRYQNAFSEVNLPEMKKGGYDLVRRMTGGGAVFHDLGNLNFSFILPLAKGQKAFQASDILAPLISYFDKAHGLKVVMEGRNDLTLPGQGKFSGLAGRKLPGGWQLHGTLLYDVDMTVLEKVLLVDPDKFRSKGVASVRARVTNLRPHLRATLAEIWRGIKESYGYIETPLPEEIVGRAKFLAETKYSQDFWNIGQSPPNDVTMRRRFPFGSLELRLSVKKNTVTEAKLTGDFLTPGEIEEPLEAEALAGALVGLPASDQEKWAGVWSGFDLSQAFGATADQEAILKWLGGE
jgi:lipoate-protein ligase A